MTPYLRSTITAVLIAVAIQCFTVGVIAPRLPSEVCRPGVRENRSLSFPKAGRLLIENAEGSIQFSTSESATIKVVADIRVYTHSYDAKPLAQEHLKSLIVAKRDGDLLHLQTESLERPDTLDIRVDYLISVPYNTALEVRCENGNVSVAQGCSDLAIYGNNTDIEILAPRGSVCAETINGRVRVYDSTGEVSLKSVNGSIYTNIRSGSVEAETTNGYINATFLTPQVATCDLTVLNGGITLLMAEHCSATVNAFSEGGVVKSEIPLAGPQGIHKRREMRGVIGAGETQLTLHALNGNILITRSTT